MFKDTSLVVIIGIFDQTLSAKTALADAAWRGFSAEAYLFITLIYFALPPSRCPKYNQPPEKRLRTGYGIFRPRRGAARRVLSYGMSDAIIRLKA